MVEASGRNARFDRIGVPDPSASRHRPFEGKEALFSTAPTAGPVPFVEVTCRRCLTDRALPFREALALLRPPFLVRPFARRILTRCPTCGDYAWLQVRVSTGLDVLLEQVPWR